MAYENQAQVEAHEPPRSRVGRDDYAARRSETMGKCRRPTTKRTRFPLDLSGLVEIELREYAGQVPETQAWCGR